MQTIDNILQLCGAHGVPESVGANYTLNNNVLVMQTYYVLPSSQETLDRIHRVLSTMGGEFEGFEISVLYDTSSRRFYDEPRSKGLGTNYICFEAVVCEGFEDWDSLFKQIGECFQVLKKEKIVTGRFAT